MRWPAIVILSVLLTWFVSATSQDTDIYPLPSHEQQVLFERLLKQLRCLVCQNQDLADSNAPLAKDLRDEVYHMVLAGKSQEQIIDYLTLRYGDFVLFQPPLKHTTYILWFAPFGLLALALAGMVWFVWRRQTGGSPC
jgi:cytochrome c-type biogenesis protein CcmH